MRSSSRIDSPTLRSTPSTAGTYGTGPLHGKLVDARGPRPSLIIAFFCLLIGYMGTKTIFDAGLKQGQEQASAAVVVLLVLCGFLTGNGGSGGASGSLNTVAKSFPEHTVSVRILFLKFLSCAYHSTFTHRELVLRPWCYLVSDSLPFCSPRSHMPPSLGTHLTSSSSWQSAHLSQWF